MFKIGARGTNFTHGVTVDIPESLGGNEIMEKFVASLRQSNPTLANIVPHRLTATCMQLVEVERRIILSNEPNSRITPDQLDFMKVRALVSHCRICVFL
jgi:hypothetical protein